MVTCYTSLVSTFEERRALRAAWPVRKVALHDEGRVDERDTTTADERLALVATLTREQWALSGRPIPEYERHEMPGRIIRPCK